MLGVVVDVGPHHDVGVLGDQVEVGHHHHVLGSVLNLVGVAGGDDSHRDLDIKGKIKIKIQSSSPTVFKFTVYIMSVFKFLATN